ncbi:MAG: translation initiation factor IF-2 N-terminal domain-containing protein, partial [Oscillospiraceae bacterium]|nr:translation initiation factor IF-2 N-terminal domain-containing protein [Oscillospiraceae bacterium]
MSNAIKYRVHEVAKDFGLPSKAVADVLAEYFVAPKNHMQALSDEELNVIFDCLTLRNQIESIEIVFSKIYTAPPPGPNAPPPPGPAGVAGGGRPAPAGGQA